MCYNGAGEMRMAKRTEQPLQDHRVWAHVPMDTWEEVMTLSKRLGIAPTKVVQISAVAGVRVIHRSIFPEDALPPEFYAKVQTEIEKLLPLKK
jgi:hypothetical protein